MAILVLSPSIIFYLLSIIHYLLLLWSFRNGFLGTVPPVSCKLISNGGVCTTAPATQGLLQWWTYIIKWTQMNIPIYLDAKLYTEWIFEYIWMPHIFRTNIQIYLYSGKAQMQIWIIFEGHFIQILEYFWKGLNHAFSKENFTLDIFWCINYIYLSF